MLPAPVRIISSSAGKTCLYVCGRAQIQHPNSPEARKTLTMTPTEIAETILNTMMPETRKMWRYEIGPATTPLQLTFWPISFVRVLDIGAVMGCFLDFHRQVSWQREVGDEPDSPRIVIQGGVKGTLVQAAFVLRDAQN
jgi:hypothetical protein